MKAELRIHEVKDFVMWTMLVCLVGGGLLALVGELIEKTQSVANFFRENDSDSKLGGRLFWIGFALLALGFALLFLVYPKV